MCVCDQHISMNCHGLYKHCWELVLMEYEQYIPMSEVRSSVHDLYIPIPPGINQLSLCVTWMNMCDMDESVAIQARCGGACVWLCDHTRSVWEACGCYLNECVAIQAVWGRSLYKWLEWLCDCMSSLWGACTCNLNESIRVYEELTWIWQYVGNLTGKIWDNAMNCVGFIPVTWLRVCATIQAMWGACACNVNESIQPMCVWGADLNLWLYVGSLTWMNLGQCYKLCVGSIIDLVESLCNRNECATVQAMWGACVCDLK